ncbi:hypothetical protein CC1G_14562 [Coprinopsis cinerea okayama7|uniref:Uncharacterized protein n=1 Tax=Coprinopsis cinerea (strain Okayama-7 / 130 / ATCC MYA-4618 / FGSC 9003) TaxID=240176 RepID=D6RMN4_COPC7|nr:hypothetical protein CC1G_14562 [Coprinopsis cinerea okayama7\|eukprot:XP_002911130.1 hypothetical protein CC1G_14562 [Coprinopsis cinerea okayama7\
MPRLILILCIPAANSCAWNEGPASSPFKAGTSSRRFRDPSLSSSPVARGVESMWRAFLAHWYDVIAMANWRMTRRGRWEKFVHGRMDSMTGRDYGFEILDIRSYSGPRTEEKRTPSDDSDGGGFVR